MQLPSFLLAGLAALATAAPFTTPSPPDLTIRADLPIDNATFCSTHNPALANAIGYLCAACPGGLILGNNWTIAESSHEYKHAPHAAEVVIQAACDSDTTGPPEDVSDLCMGIMWDLCRARIELGDRGVVLNRGRKDCQLWFIPGWDEGNFSGYEWYDLEILRMEDISAEG